MDCIMCQIRNELRDMMRHVDDLPEIGSALYDDEIAKVYNALDDAQGMFAHEFGPGCELTEQEKREIAQAVQGVCSCGHAWTAHNQNGCCWDDECECTQAPQ